MNLTPNEAVLALQIALPLLAEKDKVFANSLIGYFEKHQALSDKQLYWVAKLAASTQTVPQSSVPTQLSTPDFVLPVGDFAGVVALLAKAKEHLKYPKITLLQPHVGKVVVSLYGPKSKYYGCVDVSGDGQYPNRVWFGRVSPEGQFVPKNGLDSTVTEALQTLLQDLSADPATVAAKHGKLTGHCCFCNKVLGLGEDKRSVTVGYGPVCAGRYGLKDQWLHAASLYTTMEPMTQVVVPMTEYVTKTLAEVFNTLEKENPVVDTEVGWDVSYEEPITLELKKEYVKHVAVETAKKSGYLKQECYLCEQMKYCFTVDGFFVCPQCADEMG
jgi:hypothetical protein